MEWLLQNWVWVLFFAGMVAMHMFGHGGHGGHGGHSDGDRSGDNDSVPAGKDDVQRNSKLRSGHHH